MTLILFAIGSAGLGSLLTWMVQNNKIKTLKQHSDERDLMLQNNMLSLRQELNQYREEQTRLREEREKLQINNTYQDSEIRKLQEKLQDQKEEVLRMQEKLEKEFSLLANKIFEEKSNKFTQQNKENISNILSPLQEKIQQFEKKVEDSTKENIQRHSALETQLNHLKELNQQITREASNLTRALKGDSKMQGNWGELVLERVLEKSGLEKGSEYTVQNSFTTEDGRRVLPDVIINLPDQKKMIIDSKVSLLAYERYCNAEDEKDQQILLREHLQSIRRHVEQLGSKNYHQIYQMESPDFVLLFIPVEPAFALALKEDPQLYNSAFEQNIVIVTPTTLLATLRTIESMWQNDKQHRNAIDIAIQAGKLYDQFKNLLDDLEKIGNQLNTVQTTYSKSMTKLTGKGNLLTKVEKLKKLGAKASKQIEDKWIQQVDSED